MPHTERHTGTCYPGSGPWHFLLWGSASSHPAAPPVKLLFLRQHPTPVPSRWLCRLSLPGAACLFSEPRLRRRLPLSQAALPRAPGPGAGGGGGGEVGHHL